MIIRIVSNQTPFSVLLKYLGHYWYFATKLHIILDLNFSI